MKSRTIAVAVVTSVAIVLLAATDLNTAKGRHALLLRAQSKKSLIVTSTNLLKESERFKSEYEALKSKPGYEKLLPEKFLKSAELRLAEIEGYRAELHKQIAEYNELVFRYNNTRRPLLFGGNSNPQKLEEIHQNE